MDRIDGITDTPGGGASSNTSTAGIFISSGGISYGRRFGGINYFSKNEAAEGVPGFYETYLTNADGTADESGPNGSRIGLGATMGFTLQTHLTPTLLLRTLLLPRSMIFKLVELMVHLCFLHPVRTRI